MRPGGEDLARQVAGLASQPESARGCTKMAASNHNCTITSLSNSGPFKSYGSVRKSPVISGTFEHPVQATDTIEGLAIKYSVTVRVSCDILCSLLLCGDVYVYSLVLRLLILEKRVVAPGTKAVVHIHWFKRF